MRYNIILLYKRTYIYIYIKRVNRARGRLLLFYYYRRVSQESF